MCAINGFTKEDRELVERMDRATAHRGPDGSGSFIEGGVSLGHNRLSILDLSEAAGQPMFSPDGRYAMIYNGELYNFRELREEFPERTFKTDGDTEVILAAFARWGTDAFSRFDGMYALAIFDRKERELTIVRDSVGIKPLYYCFKDGVLAFSSELKGLAAYGVGRTLSLDALDLYLRLGYVPGPMSAFSGVMKLPPGSCGVWKNGSFSITPFRNPRPSVEEGMGRTAALELVRGAVDESVRRQLVSDRPLGIYLSGGIDSSVVLDAASRLRPGIDTFSIGFTLAPGEEPDKFNADFMLAERTARHYGATHHGFSITPEEVLPALIRAVRHLDEPLSNPTVVPMILLAQRTKEAGVDVVLGGDGGDELFGGYERYRWSMRADLFQTLPVPLRSALISVYPDLRKLNDAPGIDRYARFHFQKEELIKELMGSAYRDGAQAEGSFKAQFFAQGGDALAQFMRADREAWLVDESLHKSDRLAMAHGLEARVPLLGESVIDAACRVPSRYKTNVFDTKIVLKEAFRDRLPQYLLTEPKRGWQSPGAKWLRYPHIAAATREALSPGYHEATDSLFDWKAVERMLEAHIEGSRYSLTPLWNLLSLRLWAREYDVRI